MWEAVLGQLQLQVTRPSYQTWLKDTVGVAYHEGTFLVSTPNVFVAEMLEQRMYSLISQAMERVTNGLVEIQFEVLPKDGHVDYLDTFSPDSPLINGGPESTYADEPAQSTTPQANGHSSQPTLFRNFSLNPRYTFDSFIVGRSNELAHAAAMAVSDNPGTIYNPLVLYSDVGLGKTHLLHAIGHRIQSASLSLIYATTEEFTNEYIKAIREGRTEEFRDRYRSADALLLDDIQFLIGKEQTQEGFFHTFNALHTTNRQIIITTDRPVTALSLLEDRVRSRLSGGLVVDIQAPDLETRLAILEAKAGVMGWDIDPEVIQFLGKRVHKNVRELEGKLNRLIAYAQLTGDSITLDLVNRASAEFIHGDIHRQVSAQQVLDTVASYFLISQEDLEGRKRDKKTALARQVTMYLIREEAKLGPSAIGRVLGGKDHTTVLHGCRRITSQLNVDAHLRQDVINIREALASTPFAN